VKIAQVASLDREKTPNLYGGAERVVYLTEELVRVGHYRRRSGERNLAVAQVGEYRLLRST